MRKVAQGFPASAQGPADEASHRQTHAQGFRLGRARVQIESKCNDWLGGPLRKDFVRAAQGFR